MRRFYFIQFNVNEKKKLRDEQMRTHIQTRSDKSHANGLTYKSELTCGWRDFIAAVSKIS